MSLREDWNKYEIERYLDKGKIFIIELDSERNISKNNVVENITAFLHAKEFFDLIISRYKSLEINFYTLI